MTRPNGFLFQPDSVKELKNKITAALETSTHKKLTQGAQKESKALLNTSLSYGEAAINALYRKNNARKK